MNPQQRRDAAEMTMALKAMIDKLDSVAEGLRGEYEEITEGDNAGKFRLSVEDADSLVDTSGLKGALERERNNGKLAAAIKKEFPGATDDEIRELVKKAKGLKKGKGGKDDEDDPRDVEKLVTKLRAELDEEYAPTKKENESLKTELRTVLIDDRAKSAALKAGVFPEDVDDVIELTRKRFDLGDKRQVIVLDKDGDPTSMTLEKFYAEVFKKERPKFYKAPETSGGDADPSKKKPTKPADADLATLSPAQRLTEARRRQAATKT